MTQYKTELHTQAETIPVSVLSAGSWWSDHCPHQPPHFEFIGQAYWILASPCYGEVLLEERFKFQRLMERWHAERGVSSSITEGVLSPAYQSIIGMGEAAVPMIISELRIEGEDPDQWFWALQAITMKNPVSPENQGDFVKMAQSWIKWAESEGYAG